MNNMIISDMHAGVLLGAVIGILLLRVIQYYFNKSKLSEDAKRPKMVFLIGCKRFKTDWAELQAIMILVNEKLTLNKSIVIRGGIEADILKGTEVSDEVMENLIELDYEKIRRCESVYVVNLHNCVDSDTQYKINYALGLNKHVEYYT